MSGTEMTSYVTGSRVRQSGYFSSGFPSGFVVEPGEAEEPQLSSTATSEGLVVKVSVGLMPTGDF